MLCRRRKVAPTWLKASASGLSGKKEYEQCRRMFRAAQGVQFAYIGDLERATDLIDRLMQFLDLLRDVADETLQSEPQVQAYAWFESACDNDVVPHHWVRGFEVSVLDASRFFLSTKS